MIRYHLLVGLILSGATLSLTGAVERRTTSPAEVAPPALSPENSEAPQLLERAVAAFTPERVAWLETVLWQRIHEENHRFEVAGRFLVAPGHRMRLELQVQAGSAEGHIKLVSDGNVLWRWHRFGTGRPGETRVDLPGPSEALNSPAAVAWAKGEVLKEQAFLGVASLLQGIRERIQQAGCASVEWNGREVLRVTGIWPEDAERLKGIPAEIQPTKRPRMCCVYLDAQTLWPYRVEWWGSQRPEDRPSLLLEIEFRDPVLNVPLSVERYDSEFAIPAMSS